MYLIITLQRRQRDKKREPCATPYFSLWILVLRSRCVSVVFLWAAAPRLWPHAASILCVTHICVCPPGSLSKELGPKRQAGQAQYGRVSPALEKSSQRPDFFLLLPIFPRSSALTHLIFCESHFVEEKLEQESSSLIVDYIAVAAPAPRCQVSPPAFCFNVQSCR